MANILRLSSLIPAGLVVESAAEVDGMMVVSARSAAERRPCPLCGRFSGRVHSRYVRTIADLPRAGRKVRLRLTARRFVCEATFCRRCIFAERFEDKVVADVPNSAGKLGPGLDIRGDGGFIVAPPSLHASGKRYEWMNR